MELTDDQIFEHCRGLSRQERRTIARAGWRRGNYYGFDSRFDLSWPEYWRQFCEVMGAQQ
jgi:hypothetical protein